LNAAAKFAAAVITENAKVFSYFVRNDGVDADLNPLQGFAHEPPQSGI
jgi:hypothetical protein